MSRSTTAKTSPRYFETLDRRFAWELLAVAAETTQLLALAHQPGASMRGAEAFDMRVVRCPKPIWQQDFERRPIQVVRRPPEDLLGALVEEDDPLVIIDGDHGVRRDREQTGEQFRGQRPVHRRMRGSLNGVLHHVGVGAVGPKLSLTGTSVCLAEYCQHVAPATLGTPV
jgi:hypothetical protein